jgi:hypothetical protein
VLASIALATPISAQDNDGSIGYGGGGMYFTDFNSGGAGTPFGLEPGWVATAHMDHWVNRGRLGGRINAAFTRRPMETVGDVREIHTWVIGADLLLRFARPRPGRSVAPFISAGGGIISYGLGEGPSVVLSPEAALYPGDTDRQFTVSGGLGFDIMPGFEILGSPAGFRLEAIDHMALQSPFDPVAGSAFDPVHNIRVSLGLMGLVHLSR